MIGQWLAANAPDRLTHVILANTSSRFPDPSVMETRGRTVLESGMAALEDAVMRRFFSEGPLKARRLLECGAPGMGRDETAAPVAEMGGRRWRHCPPAAWQNLCDGFRGLGRDSGFGP